MYRITQGSTHDLDDAVAFLQFLNTLEQTNFLHARTLFERNSDLFVSRAPGRLDVMGGIADYSGSLVLELPLREATFSALQRSSDRRVRIVSIVDSNRELVFEMGLEDLESSGGPINYNNARDYFQRDSANDWAAYVAGAFLVLMQERQISFEQGARMLIWSQVPEGKGVSSSAALEVAAMQSVAAAFAVEVEPRELALLCQKVENLVVGAPCGIMDQMTSVRGESNRLLALLCQPAEVLGSIAIPEGLRFWGIDSGIRHSVSGADYGQVRTGAFMGYRMIADLARLPVVKTREELCTVEDPRWHGYLANISPSEFVAYGENLPETISGADFLKRFECTTDPVTRINPGTTYRVRMSATHPVSEHERVKLFADLLGRVQSEEQMMRLGELMYQSHESYSACGLNSEGTDLLVELVREAGASEGLYGAKITGGGSGGTVAVLGSSNASSAIDRVAENYEHKTGYSPYIFTGSSPGSAAFGSLRLQN
jgi:galactokinase